MWCPVIPVGFKNEESAYDAIRDLPVHEGCYTREGRLRKRCPDIITILSFYWSELRQMDVKRLMSINGGAGVGE
jgi:hypothetical protein